jgi:hypothetical protein
MVMSTIAAAIGITTGTIAIMMINKSSRGCWD